MNKQVACLPCSLFIVFQYIYIYTHIHTGDMAAMFIIHCILNKEIYIYIYIHRYTYVYVQVTWLPCSLFYVFYYIYK